MRTTKITRPADILLASTIALGFEPVESFVALSVRPGGFHVRIDHPHTSADMVKAAEHLGVGFRNNPGGLVVLVSFTDNEQDALDTVTVMTAMIDGLADVVHAWRIDGNNVYDIPTGQLIDRITPSMRVEYAAHRASLGRPAVAETRDAREASLFQPQPAPPVEAITASTEALAALAADPDRLADEVRWVIETVRIHALIGLRVEDQDAARLIVDAGHRTLMQAALAQIDSDTAANHADLWTNLTNRAPGEHATSPALIASFAHWLSGDGAAAWMAHDKAQAPDHRFAVFMRTALDEGIDPRAWINSPSFKQLQAEFDPDA